MTKKAKINLLTLKINSSVHLISPKMSPKTCNPKRNNRKSQFIVKVPFPHPTTFKDPILNNSLTLTSKTRTKVTAALETCLNFVNIL